MMRDGIEGFWTEGTAGKSDSYYTWKIKRKE
jgi:hypothetical protein